ncbi:MAG: hypothetical protein AAF713_13130 [Pseudomonadota bacterium]
MTRLDTRLVDVLEPVRDVAVGEILETMATALGEGADVHAEPMVRDANGRSLRDGALKLPRRADLRVVANGHALVRRVETEQRLAFDPVTMVAPNGFAAVFTPFDWDSCEIEVEPGASKPDWAPLRRWFLEWIQSRFTEVSPDLEGAVHSIEGPFDIPKGWRFSVDFGSAPVECIGDLMDAFAESGAARIRIGPRRHSVAEH